MGRLPPHRHPPADSAGQHDGRDDIADLHRRTRVTGANRLMYLFVRCTFTPFFLTYFRMKRIGRQHVPKRGPVIVASNHRSFLDPFVLATLAWRPMYYVTKQELFAWPVLAWVLSALGAFPVQRGAGDAETIETAKAILARGDIVLIFPEGTRTRPGPLGKPKRGVGRLALETGAPVVPTAVIGSEAVRRGWRIRPHNVRIRAGRPLVFPRVPDASPAMAGAVTEQIWARIELQWEWLGGSGPIRRAAIIGSGPPARHLEAVLTRAGVQVDIGDELELGEHDLVCLAVPAGALAGVLSANPPRIPSHAGVLILSAGLVPPAGHLPSEFVAQRSRPRAIAVSPGIDDSDATGPVTLASTDRGFGRQVSAALRAGRLASVFTTDAAGVQFAACARQAARLAASVAGVASPALAGAAAQQVYAEVRELGLSRGGRPESFVALSPNAGTGSVSEEREGNGGPPSSSPREPAVQEPPSAAQLELIALLAAAARDAGVEAPALAGLAAVAQGMVTPHHWTAALAARNRPVGSSSTRVA